MWFYDTLHWLEHLQHQSFFCWFKNYIQNHAYMCRHVWSNKNYTDKFCTFAHAHRATLVNYNVAQVQRDACKHNNPPGCAAVPVSSAHFLFSTPATSFTSSLPPSLSTPPVPLSGAPGIFRYWSPHYGSIQPQQTHKQISRLRRSQSPSPSLLCRAIRPQHTPVRWARGKAYCRLQPPRAPPPNPSASQPRVTAAPNTIKSHLQNAQA